MEHIKKFITNTRITAIIGLIGSIILFILQYISFRHFHILTRITFILSYLGLMIYFIIIVMRIYLKKGNIKFANNFLIASFLISIILKILSLFIFYKFFSGIVADIPILDLLLLLYFVCIIYKRKTFINNKIFALVLLIYFLRIIVAFCSNKYINYYTGFQALSSIGYLMIIPYFYNYYNLIERSLKNAK